MKNTVFILVLSFAALFNHTLTAQAEDQAVVIVKEAIAGFFDYDAARFTADFSEATELVNPYGMVMVGRQMIHDMHLPVFESWAGSVGHFSTSRESVRYVQPDLAIVNMKVVQWTTVNEEEVDRMEVALVATVAQTDGTWKVETFSVTPILPLPGAPQE